MLNLTNNNYIDTHSPFASIKFSNLILEYLRTNIKSTQELIILCIGTDRSTGDSLGPLVGYKLTPHLNYYDNVKLLGTLDNPIHAKNLNDTLNEIGRLHREAFIIAVDASLGTLDKIGYINIKKGPLKPGLGVNKNLPTIGDISITAVVNVCGMMEYMVLQNTRLSLVMNMADIISKGISRSLYKLYNKSLREENK
ncbi:spore protease YyaC [Schnuerera sp. xch1]|uniref:spore protease YyaC n=1 Tax=Schnuerera sp. xch1 TaxID=2874283 RepID=UPI001CBEFF1A|nr:spore protease YyaC [Schnuerera sp. xch1]MBZ2175681.1 spore protease YyaC [Schnuerera sp. xch1]